ncbi:MAG: serine peptidase, partial [bacterium]|nr:serine peptidase [bacterium]
MKNPVKPTSALMAFAVAIILMAGQLAEARTLPDFTGLVDKFGPAVVNISTTQKKAHHGMLPKGFKLPDIPENTPFQEFFRRFFGEGGEAEEFDSQSLGSGFIVSRDGYVVTNNHVIQEAEEIVVRLGDRREFIAEIVGIDERSDLAVLKIDAENLPAVRL